MMKFKFFILIFFMVMTNLGQACHKCEEKKRLWKERAAIARLESTERFLEMLHPGVALLFSLSRKMAEASEQNPQKASNASFSDAFNGTVVFGAGGPFQSDNK